MRAHRIVEVAFAVDYDFFGWPVFRPGRFLPTLFQEPPVKSPRLLAAPFSLLIAGAACGAEPAAEPLAAYVAKEDASYRWTLRWEGSLGASSCVELILTSQTWRDIVWKHQLFLIRPANLDTGVKHALLYIAGGDWKDELERPRQDGKLPGEALLFGRLAERMRTPVAVLLHVPQQPIFDGKREDQIIAFTFENYLRTKDPQWPLLLPMVKSTVRAMDAVQEWAADRWSLKIETFTLSGASKRGWTTWLAGAVDSRATALAPMVIDVLNMGPQLDHQKKTWGALSYKISDYTERGLDKHLQSDEGKTLRQIVDPYSYRQHITQPKLIILGTNDHYWPLDALNLYWDGLAGPSYILYTPNNGHGLSDLEHVTGSLIALQQHAAVGARLPKLAWQFSPGPDQLALRVESDLHRAGSSLAGRVRDPRFPAGPVAVFPDASLGRRQPLRPGDSQVRVCGHVWRSRLRRIRRPLLPLDQCPHRAGRPGWRPNDNGLIPAGSGAPV